MAESTQWRGKGEQGGGGVRRASRHAAGMGAGGLPKKKNGKTSQKESKSTAVVGVEQWTTAMEHSRQVLSTKRAKQSSVADMIIINPSCGCLCNGGGCWSGACHQKQVLDLNPHDQQQGGVSKIIFCNVPELF